LLVVVVGVGVVVVGVAVVVVGVVVVVVVVVDATNSSSEFSIIHSR